MEKFTWMTKTEKKVYELLKERKWDTVLHSGWPDFVAMRDDGEVTFVEVKPKGEELRESQKQMREVFTRLGLPYHVVQVEQKGPNSWEFVTS